MAFYNEEGFGSYDGGSKMDGLKSTFIDLSFESKWTYISAVRTFLQNFVAITLDDKQKADVIAMAVNELVENAVKYSDRDSISIRLDVDPGTNDIRVQVANYASKKEVAILKSILEEIYSKNPMEAYIDRMKETNLMEDKKSTLGLARIRYEAGADLLLSSEGDRIEITAVFRQSSGGADE